ncbi:response regulator transcription factor [Exilibacterium tricleocarpae]|uniref:Response regulator transcription factor n=1 Tax=Exilibacterium tricleocarpae TaxID=2591008 RepID=A0A545TQC8_9GAMM|nr:response regulator transcription factor [Exilibacterium tricleocarpae]TQV79439.1 response regulator transcription factor [Exilibacterium tricleocarpae]
MVEKSSDSNSQSGSIIRVVLIDDHPLIRAGIRNIIERAEHIKVVGESDNGYDAIPVVIDLKPDVVLVDIEMPVMGGIDFSVWLHQNHPHIKIIILSSYDDDAYIRATLRAGANGYLLKNSTPKQIIHTIEEVVADHSSFDPDITEKIVHLLTSPNKPGNSPEQLPSKRELEILALVAKGYTNNDIGKKLHISSRTVQGHLSKAFSKLEVNTRTEAVTKAASLKLLDLESSDGV